MRPPPKKPSIAERLDQLKLNPFAPTLSDYAPGEHGIAARLEAAKAIEARAKRIAVPAPLPLRTLGSIPPPGPPRPESPLAIKALRLPGKPADALNSYFRRMVDERRAGADEATAMREAVAAGWRAFTDLNRDVPPTGVRAMTGAKAGESSRTHYNLSTAADYLLSGLLDPSAIVTGPVGRLIGKGAMKIPAVAQAAATAGAVKTAAKAKVGTLATQLEKTVVGAPGSLRGQVLAHTLGVGPTARMMREVRQGYEPEVGTRFKEAEAIVSRMRDWVVRKRKIDPVFSRDVEQYRRLHPGKLDPLTDVVRMYIRAHRHKGQTRTSKSVYPAGSGPPLDPFAEAAAQNFARAHRIPWDRVEEFGDAIIAHGEETLSSLRHAGANPFEQARGLGVKKPLGASPPRWAQQQWSGIPAGADARAQDRLRRHWFRFYVEDVLPHATKTEGGLHTLGPQGIRVGRGKHGEVLEGIQSVRRAGVRNLFTGLKKTGEYLKTWAPGTDVPRGWVVVSNSGQVPREATKVPWTGGMDFARDTMMPETLWNYMAGEMAQFLPTVNKAGRIVGVEGLFSQRLREIGAQITRYVGAQKRAWLNNPATWLTNAVGNHMLTTSRLEREGVGVIEFMLNLKASLKEAYAFEKTAAMSPDIRSMSGHTRAFLESIAEGAGVRPGKSGEAAAGVAGKRVDKGPLAGKTIGPFRTPDSVLVPDPGFDQISGKGARRRLAMAGAVVKTAAGEGERLLSAMGSIHGLSERAYKLALFKTMAPRVGAKRAAKIVDETLFDYSDRPAMLEMLDRYGFLVFNAFPMFALKNTLETFVTRPDLVARYPRLARLSQIEAGGQEAADQMDQGERPSHLVGTGENTFLDPSRYFPQAGAIDYLSRPGESLGREDLSRLPGRTAFSPYIEQGLNRRLYAGIEDAPPIVPPGTPPSLSPFANLPGGAAVTGEEGDLRAREFLNAILPGGVRAAGRLERAEAGIASGRGALSTPQTKAEAFLQGILGVRTLREEGVSEAGERAGELAGIRFQTLGRIIGEVTDRMRAEDPTGEKNPYLGEARKLGRKEDVERALKEVQKNLDGLAPQSISDKGIVTGDGLRRIKERVKWQEALLFRLREL